jgi:hypothetical protein
VPDVRRMCSAFGRQRNNCEVDIYMCKYIHIPTSMFTYILHLYLYVDPYIVHTYHVDE